MAQSKILVDTNTYLRLAQTIRPLLFVPFGESRNCLYVIPELNLELSGRRLVTKFPWVEQPEYTENRNFFPKLSRKQTQSIADTFEYVWDHVISDLPGPSRIDARYIAYAIELQVPVITDDQDMTQLAETFGAMAMPTLQLLRIMLDCGLVNMRTIDGMVDYWRYVKDCPANLDSDYKRFFT